MRLKHWFFIIIAILILWLLYMERTIFSPFIVAAIFAYIFNPVINFASKKLKIPRSVGIIIVYSVLLAIIIFAGAILIKRISEESIDISKSMNNMIDSARVQIYTLPDWVRPAANDFLINLKKSRFVTLFKSSSTVPVFSQAISRVISFFIFLFSGYYFLKDGENGISRLLTSVPKKYKSELEMLLQKINTVLGGYLRGQVLLIFIMSLILYIALSILGVRYALTFAIFSGFAEIIPVIGPITAGALTALFVLFTGTSSFGLLPLQTALVVILIYFVFRQLEDYFVIPHVMGKITKLPPFVIFFSVIAGGHLAGILGLILAVPIAAVIRLLLEFSMDIISIENKKS